MSTATTTAAATAATIFRPLSIYCDQTRGLALSLLGGGDPSSLPILADALEERGYGDKKVLKRLRKSNHHPELLASLAAFGSAAEVRSSIARKAAAARVAKRQADRQAELARRQEELRQRAIAVAEAYHDRVRSLYTSKRASVSYGRGGQRQTDWEAYSKSYGYPANWSDAGVIADTVNGTEVYHLYTSRDTHVAAIPQLPTPTVGEVVLKSGSLLPGDLFAIRREIAGVIVATRYGLRRARHGESLPITHDYRQTGVAVAFSVPTDLIPFWPVKAVKVLDRENHYWEHGATVSQCREEYARKLQAAEENRIKSRVQSDPHSKKVIARAVRMILANADALGIRVGYDDLRQVGACHAGIMGYAGSIGLDTSDLTQTVPLSQLYRYSDHWGRAVASRMVTSRMIERERNASKTV